MGVTVRSCEPAIAKPQCDTVHARRAAYVGMEPKLHEVIEGAEAIQLPSTCHTKGANAAGTPVAQIDSRMEWAPAADQLDLLSG